MNKEFIPYEQALALKELGFNEPCFGCFLSSLIPSNFTEYHLETEFGMNEGPSDWKNNNFLDKACSAPLYQQAFRWFRDKGIYGELTSDLSNNLEGRVFVYSLYSETRGYFVDRSEEYKTYEEAELACLKKLIEITKNQQQI